MKVFFITVVVLTFSILDLGEAEELISSSLPSVACLNANMVAYCFCGREGTVQPPRAPTDAGVGFGSGKTEERGNVMTGYYPMAAPLQVRG